ncbi:MAG: CDP-alcohol phosphatidyltransferase family protein [Actinobacteria bacterium]|nr:CDP-alcohol phosphatidyltransferase family protein [Actinomycetota bacterium]
MGGEEGGVIPEENAPDAPDRGHKMDEGLRWFGDFIFKPILWFFGRLGISPNLITVLGMAVAIASGYFLAVKRVPLAAVFFVLSGVLDLADGYVAKKLDQVTVFGSFLDSFSDRISDVAIYVGLMVYYLKLQEGIYVGLAVVLLVASFLISYLRARAEALGLQCKAGLMSRAPRVLAVGFGLFFNGLSPWILKIVMWVVAALLVETLAERFVFVWRELEA